MGAPSQLPPGSQAPPCAATEDEPPPVSQSTSPSTEEMRRYRDEGRYMMPIRVGSTWMFGSGNEWVGARSGGGPSGGRPAAARAD